MIIKEHQLEKIVRDSKTFLNILIYGPNEGLVREQIEKLTKDYFSKGNYEEISFNGKDLDDDAGSLEAIIRSVPMFFENKIVIADSIKDKHLSIIEEIVLKAPEQAVLVITEGSLSKSSKIRKFFEEHKTCYALACYEDDGRSTMKNIDEFARKNNIELSRDIKNYLLQSLSNDRMISKHELEKIGLLYKDSKSKIKLEEIRVLLNDSSSQNLNKMNEYVMFGNTNKSSKIVDKLLTEGASPISLVRSLSNYMLRVQKTKIEMKKGSNFDIAIKSLRPPVFWKDKDNFERHCRKWPLSSIENSLFKLLEAEVSCKLNSSLATLNCEKSILLVADSGRNYFRN
tara:strand:+ start:809 stop:1834 length:1026 start_codon:yes stop_codon:yes gene_type:complete